MIESPTHAARRIPANQLRAEGAATVGRLVGRGLAQVWQFLGAAALAFLALTTLAAEREATLAQATIAHLEAAALRSEQRTVDQTNELVTRHAAAEALGARLAARIAELEAVADSEAAARRAADAARVTAEQGREAAEADLRAARQRAESLAAGLARTDQARQRLEQERDLASRELDSLERRIAAERVEAAARRREERSLAARLGELERTVRAAAREVTDWNKARIAALDAALRPAGIAWSELIASVDDDAVASGGPFEPLPMPLIPDPGEWLHAALGEHAAVQGLLERMPSSAPIDDFVVASVFGRRTDPFTGRPAMHRGLDLVAPKNAPVRAAGPGIVRYSGARGPYGTMVEIDHGDGLVSRYAHLKRALVPEGARVKRRQPIGIIGTTGRSTGRHLHFEVRDRDRPVDPSGFLEAGRRLAGLDD